MVVPWHLAGQHMIDELLGLVYIITVFCENGRNSDKDCTCSGYLGWNDTGITSPKVVKVNTVQKVECCSYQQFHKMSQMYMSLNSSSIIQCKSSYACHAGAKTFCISGWIMNDWW